MSAAYKNLSFATADGGKFAIGAQNLVITVSGDKVTATNGKDDALEFDTSSLSYMEFTDFEDPAKVDRIEEFSGPATLYTLDGQPAGRFGSLEEARSSLAGGIYVVRLADGSSLKVYIKK